MKLKLTKDEGSGSLRTYLKKRFTLSQLAQKIGTSNQNLHAILTGSQKRPDHRKLQAIAEKCDLVLGFDDIGEPYFEISSQDIAQNHEYISEEKLNAILQAKYAALSADKRKLFDSILDFMLDPDANPDKKKLFVDMIKVFAQQ
jgi:transcriptional regulator with XRE-family HTH domain